MKTLRTILALCMAVFILTSCSDDDDDDNKIAVTGIEFPAKVVNGAITLTEGATEALAVTVKPDNATDKKVTYTSSDTKVFTVDENGSVKAVAAGKATLTATSKSNSKITVTCEVTVVKAGETVPVESIAINGLTEGKLTMEVGEEITTITATVTPENATDKSVKFTSSKPEIFTVTEDGKKITAVAAGDAKLIVTAQDGSEVKAECDVVVTAAASEDYVELVNTDWSVTASDEELSEGGQAMGILANDPANKFWHSDWSSESPAKAPHWLLIDMKKVENVAQVEIIHRIKNGNPLIEITLGKIFLSAKNEDNVAQDDASFGEAVAEWDDHGLASSSPSAENPASESLTLEAPKNARYIKILIPDNDVAHIGALKVYKPAE